VIAERRRQERECRARREYGGSKSTPMKNHLRPSFERYISKKMAFFNDLASHQ
jgi:hypothetical protein